MEAFRALRIEPPTVLSLAKKEELSVRRGTRRTAAAEPPLVRAAAVAVRARRSAPLRAALPPYAAAKANARRIASPANCVCLFLPPWPQQARLVYRALAAIYNARFGEVITSKGFHCGRESRDCRKRARRLGRSHLYRPCQPGTVGVRGGGDGRKPSGWHLAARAVEPDDRSGKLPRLPGWRYEPLPSRRARRRECLAGRYAPERGLQRSGIDEPDAAASQELWHPHCDRRHRGCRLQ